jgi:hypothetical protein
LEIARAAAFPDGVESLATRKDVPVNFHALVLAMEGQQGKALEVLDAEVKARPSSWNAMRAALMADLVADEKRRDALLKQVAEQPPQPATPNDNRPHREELVILAKALIADLASGGKCDFDLEKLHSARDEAPPFDHCSFNYFLASYLDQRGKTDHAIKYWKECMGANDLGTSLRTAAGFELTKHGVKPSEWKQLLFAKPDKGAQK